MAVENDGSLIYVVGAASGVGGSLASILMSRLSGRQVVATMVAAIFLGSMTGPVVLYLRHETPVVVAGTCGFFVGFLSLFLVPAGMKFGERLTAKLFGLAEQKLGLPSAASADAPPAASASPPPASPAPEASTRP